MRQLAAAVEKVEDAVVRLHEYEWLSPAEQNALRQAVRTFAGAKTELAAKQVDQHKRRLQELTNQQQKLIQLYYQDAISVDALQAEQDRIEQEQLENRAMG